MERGEELQRYSVSERGVMVIFREQAETSYENETKRTYGVQTNTPRAHCEKRASEGRTEWLSHQNY